MAARKSKRKKKENVPHVVRCSPEMGKAIDAVRDRFRVDRSEVWRWAMSVALRELNEGRVTGPGEPGVPMVKEVAHVAA